MNGKQNLFIYPERSVSKWKKPWPCWCFFLFKQTNWTNEHFIILRVCVLFFDWCVFMLLFFCMSSKTSLHFPPFASLSLSDALFFSRNHLTLKLFKPLQADWKLTSNLFCSACVWEIGTKTDLNHHHHDHKKFHSTLYAQPRNPPSLPLCRFDVVNIYADKKASDASGYTF